MRKDINKVISSNGINDLYTFYTNQYPQYGNDYSSWLAEFDEKRVERFSLVFTGQKGVSHKILYMHALSSIDNKNLGSSIVATINEEKLTNKLKEIDEINQGTSMIVAGDNKIVASAKEVYLPENLNFNSNKRDNNFLYEEINGEKVVISFISSRINGWRYVTIVPETVFLAKVNHMRGITYTGIAVGFLVGAFFIYYFLKRNYNPLGKLLNALKNQPNFLADKDGKDSNEYVIIENAIKKAIDDKNVIADQLSNQKQILKTNFLEKIIKGNAHEEIPLEEALHSYRIEFNSNSFIIMSFFLEDTIPDNFNEDTNKFNIVQFVFKNVVEELVGQYHKSFLVDIDGIMTCLVNVDDNREDLRVDLLDAVSEAQKFIDEHFHIRFTVSISNKHTGIEQIPIAYRESLDVMNYKKVLGVRKTLFYDEVNSVYQGTYYYPIAKEQQLLNCIKCGDYQEAKAVVSEIFKINFEQEKLSLDLAQCLMLNLVSTMIRAVNEVANNYKDNFLEELNPISRLLPCKTVDEMKKQLGIFLEAFCKHMNKINKYNSKWVITEVIPFINKNYNNPNLSVAEIAEKFDVHPVYISKAFKDEAGEGLLDFINKTRIENAKIQLKERRNDNLEDICKDVGFSNVRTFSRVFKKYEGVAPGKYKELL
jgi:AraC-like DNA-binding protein